ncbi:MAG: VCBS repeat-containing protein [Alphaproteobacteria bacterium]|nr:VCBS repeat-containing protein [Alphaproteobacteria bacterium]
MARTASLTDDTADDTGAASVDTAEGRFLWTALSPTPSWTANVSGFGTGLGWIDVDQDGDDDLIVAYGNDMSPGPLRLYLNLDGALDPEPAWRSEDDHYYGHLSVGDVNGGDGWPDVAVSRFLGDGRFGDLGGVEVFLNDAGALQEQPAWESAEAFYSFSCALGDVDNDGDLDLAAALRRGLPGRPDYTRVFLNDGQGGFGEAAAWTEDRPRHGFDVAWADFNEDGWLDLVVANNGSAHALYLNEGGALAASPAWEAEGEPERFEGNSLTGATWTATAGWTWSSPTTTSSAAPARSASAGPTLERCWESADPPAYQSAVSLRTSTATACPSSLRRRLVGPRAPLRQRGRPAERRA